MLAPAFLANGLKVARGKEKKAGKAAAAACKPTESTVGEEIEHKYVSCHVWQLKLWETLGPAQFKHKLSTVERAHFSAIKYVLAGR